jgi:MarR family 2-MHQ and catechol resistance regulon transcriptional repressor
MSLKDELGLINPIKLRAHEALLNIYYTASCLKKRAGEFLQRFGLTDVQFNLMMLLHYQSSVGGGISQTGLSAMMLVNRADITSLVDRMEKSGLVVRTTRPEDRRYNVVKLSPYGRKLLAQVEPLYAREVKKIMDTFTNAEQQRLIKMHEKIRSNIRAGTYIMRMRNL